MTRITGICGVIQYYPSVNCAAYSICGAIGKWIPLPLFLYGAAARQSIAMPPFTCSVAPVTYPASGLAR